MNEGALESGKRTQIICWIELMVPLQKYRISLAVYCQVIAYCTHHASNGFNWQSDHTDILVVLIFCVLQVETEAAAYENAYILKSFDLLVTKKTNKKKTQQEGLPTRGLCTVIK